MNIYYTIINDREDIKGKNREALIKYCLNDFVCSKKMNIDVEDLEILRSEGGKPYVDISNLFFNISHSKDLWVCAVDNLEVGVDIQYRKEINYKRFSRRFFTNEEIEYINSDKLDSYLTEIIKFYRIWTVKEAITKYYGLSIFDIMKRSVYDVESKKFICDNFNLYSFSFMNNYECSVATLQEDSKYNIIEIDSILE
ncbi:MAG: 4'-phosphopantetheinyl transferase superfamily protein [Eubacteriales bacterium]|nr:4'-phosphopantetheinyl transferase superfamily protein [Eubacteriales bacterium]MDY3332604.1 4'-phosphopantetheinyl transferase superfamily protein [Gallibacter sp.]